MEMLFGAFVVLCSLCLCILMVAYTSLQFRVMIWHISDNALVHFLDSLQFPLRYFFAQNQLLANFTNTKVGSTTVETIKNTNVIHAIIIRLFWSLLVISLPTVGFTAFLRAIEQDTGVNLFNLIVSIIITLAFIWAWQFGHQLKSIEAKLASEIPDLAEA